MIKYWSFLSSMYLERVQDGCSLLKSKRTTENSSSIGLCYMYKMLSVLSLYVSSPHSKQAEVLIWCVLFLIYTHRMVICKTSPALCLLPCSIIISQLSIKLWPGLAINFWWLARVTLVVGLVFLPQNFGLRWGPTNDICHSTNSYRWWVHINTKSCNQNYLTFLH